MAWHSEQYTFKVEPVEHRKDGSKWPEKPGMVRNLPRSYRFLCPCHGEHMEVDKCHPHTRCDVSIAPGGLFHSSTSIMGKNANGRVCHFFIREGKAEVCGDSTPYEPEGRGILKQPHLFLNYGAGTQSTFMALALSDPKMREKWGLPLPELAIFADTGGEPQAVYDYLELVKPRLAFPLEIVQREYVSMKDEYKKALSVNSWKLGESAPTFFKRPDGRMGMSNRMCTHKYKARPIIRAVIRHMNEELGINTRLRKLRKEYEDDALAKQIICYSYDEFHRAGNKRQSGQPKWLKMCYPLIDNKINRQDSIDMVVNKYGMPPPPRSSCVWCPFHSNVEWNKMSDADIATAAEYERGIQVAARHNKREVVPYLHRSLVPIDQRPFDRTTQKSHGQQIIDFDRDSEGSCTGGCFT